MVHSFENERPGWQGRWKSEQDVIKNVKHKVGMEGRFYASVQSGGINSEIILRDFFEKSLVESN